MCRILRHIYNLMAQRYFEESRWETTFIIKSIQQLKYIEGRRFLCIMHSYYESTNIIYLYQIGHKLCIFSRLAWVTCGLTSEQTKQFVFYKKKTIRVCILCFFFKIFTISVTYTLHSNTSIDNNSYTFNLHIMKLQSLNKDGMSYS